MPYTKKSMEYFTKILGRKRAKQIGQETFNKEVAAGATREEALKRAALEVSNKALSVSMFGRENP